MVTTNILPAGNPHEQSTLTEAERQELLLEKLDLTGLEAWPTEQAEKACSLLREYHDIFSLEKHDTGHTKAAKHKIVLKIQILPHSRRDSAGSLRHNWMRCALTSR